MPTHGRLPLQLMLFEQHHALPIKWMECNGL